jgi:hypothetical protein
MIAALRQCRDALAMVADPDAPAVNVQAVWMACIKAMRAADRVLASSAEQTPAKSPGCPQTPHHKDNPNDR